MFLQIKPNDINPNGYFCQMPYLPKHIPPQTLQQHIDTTALRTQLLAQTAKDLAFEAIDISPDEVHFFEKLHQKIYIFFEDLLGHSPQKLAQLLYRVDIAEHKAQKFLLAENPIQAFTEGILQREMLKIVVRNVHNGTLQL